jgi:hypothetical protein
VSRAAGRISSQRRRRRHGSSRWEIARAQFRTAYKATRFCRSDQLNEHHLFHVHPTVGSHLFTIGHTLRMRALRYRSSARDVETLDHSRTT